jgi:threonine dehydrogenase-like Zn-dependent dehydrogenase
MQAVVYTAPLELELHDIPEPKPAAGEVLVDVRAVGICGSELEGFRSRSPFRVPPLVMGHEIAGVGAPPRAPVAINPRIYSHHSALCLRGQANLCRSRALLGVHRPGGFATRVAVPEGALHPLPEGMSFERAALAEPLANAVHAIRLAQQLDPQPQTVGVIGAGMLGLALGIVARRVGAEVQICDLSEERLATAARAGLRTAARLDGEFDLVVDAVGSAATRQAGMSVLRPGGTAVWLGLHGPDAGIDALALTRSEQRVLGTFAYIDRDFRAGLALAGEIEIDGWIAQRPLAEGVDGFLGLLDGPAAATKTLLIPEHVGDC